jgi:hypothetical protein
MRFCDWNTKIKLLYEDAMAMFSNRRKISEFMVHAINHKEESDNIEMKQVITARY